MERVILVVALSAVAVLVAALLRRRQTPPAPVKTGYNVPDHVDRTDFDLPSTAWLVAVFTSATCNTCAEVVAKAKLLASYDVAVQEVEVGAAQQLHTRYGINGVPATLVVDRSGEVRASFLGPVTSADLWATVAELREPGTLPEGSCDHGTAR